MTGQTAAAGVGPGRHASRSPRAPAGDARPRLGGRSVLFAFAAVVGTVLVLAVVLATLADVPEPPPDCEPGTECGGPPPGVGVEVRAGTPSTNSELGYEFEYTDWWAVDAANSLPGEIHLTYQGASGDGLLVVAAVPASDAGPEAYADRWFETLKEEAPDLRVDTSAKNAILGPEIGFVDGIGRTYAGSWTRPPSATTPVGIGLVVASDGRITAAVVVIVWNPDERIESRWFQYQVRETAEVVLKTFRWGPLQ